MAMIKGETVYIITQVAKEDDPFNNPVIGDGELIAVENVLVSPGASEDIIDRTNLTGKTISYTLSIPKTDTNDWTNKKVMIRGELYKTVGKAYYYTDANVPLDWNGKIMVEQYE